MEAVVSDRSDRSVSIANAVGNGALATVAALTLAITVLATVAGNGASTNDSRSIEPTQIWTHPN
ncbi:hypothetical protein C7B77_26055 [Chamaesiphon polymorphus CCALA 037]|uniref:Uncharacterized protein n=2 Tax=Chamaesiphon TaxID=217161 RepID=A0A2T1FF87_9CYAN|nr:hypothetical protein C7B77_26055 [Chamaesiphon polymorphus CCALA 037]